jgi:hypothetical protein
MGSRFGLAVGSALLAWLVWATAALASAPPSTIYSSVTAGMLTRTGGAALAPQLAPAQQQRRHGIRRVPQSPTAAAPATSAPVAAATSLASPSPALLTNFNGVSSRDSALTNFGAEFEPPDQGLCVGNGFVVEMVNSAYTVFNTKGKTITGPFNVNAPFDEGLTEFTSDPRCYYDAATNTWFATILQINKEETGSALEIAVNNSGDPSTAWTAYRIDTSGLGGASGPKDPGCPCFGDQPTLGIDSHNLYVTTNEFSILGPQFNGAQIYAIAKKDLASLSPSVHFVHFAKLRIGGAPAASVQPSLMSGSPPAEYFLSALDPHETFDQRIGVWALSNAGAVAQGGTPTLSSLVLSSQAYGVPPKAQQLGSTSLIDAGDDRMQQVQFTGGGIWGELTTALTLPGDPTQRAGAAWFQVKPSLAGGVLSGAHIQRQGYVAVSGSYVMYPALQVTAGGGAAMVVSISGRSRHPSAAYALLAPEASSFGPVTVAAAGSSVYDPEATRWGDYSFAVLDPAGTSAWLATEYVPPKASQTVDGLRNWGTRVLQVAP